MIARYLSKSGRLRLVFALAASLFLNAALPLHAQQAPELSDEELNRLVDKAIACDNDADATEDPTTRFASKIRCYDDLVPYGDVVPEAMENVTYYEERLAEFLAKKGGTATADSHPYQAAYRAMRGYTSAARPSPDKECKDTYGPFDVTVDSNGIAEFSIGERTLRGVVDRNGNLTVDGRKTGKAGNKKIGLIAGKKFNSRFTIDGPINDAVMISGYCKKGYFRMEKE